MECNLVIISGCSGGGKSSLLEELSRRGYAIVKEPGRRIVQRETELGGTALPWLEMEAFARAAIAMALEDRSQALTADLVFFDRSLIDAASALRAVTGDPVIETMSNQHRYNRLVFLTPPWPEIYVTDPERRHGLEQAIEEYERLVRDYAELGYETLILPKTSIKERADFILRQLGAPV